SSVWGEGWGEGDTELSRDLNPSPHPSPCGASTLGNVTWVAAPRWGSSRSFRRKKPKNAPYRRAKSLRLTSAKWRATPPGLSRKLGRQASSQARRSASGHSLTDSERGYARPDVASEEWGLLLITQLPPSRRPCAPSRSH